jgi:photosystem II stability/assembly factor-like uncharacterized protein
MSAFLRAFVTIFVFTTSAIGSAAAQAPVTADQIRNLEFRNPGPAVTGGRIHDVEALPDDPSTIYVATASGGIWKSTNKGTTWTSVFDHQAVSTFGDIDISPSNPQIIWAGTGEQNNRQSTSWGNGVYRSTNGGETWTHVGLDDTRHIGRVRVHPGDPNTAYVAALGNLWKGSDARGVYKTTNGGGTWERVLFVDSLTGFVDLVMDPAQPNTLYAAAYQRQRRAWGFNGGGPSSGIYKTTDGGRTWRALTQGLPPGDKGRIGLAISSSNPRVLVATVEHADNGRDGTYRTVNGGESWERVNALNPRPMYYSHVFIDPTDENRVYVLATAFYTSADGGRSFGDISGRLTYDVGVHSDFHSMWIDPTDPEHFYLAGDGGLYETWDRGENYIKINNMPIAQFYAIGVDWQEPYNIFGGMQDNHSWMGPSATRRWIGIINDDWRQIGFGDGMYHQPDPTTPRYEYGASQNGNIVRLDALTGDLLDIRPQEPIGEEEYRFDWVTPILISRHDPRVVYLGGNRLFITQDRGISWTRTQDLSRQIDRDTLRIMGVLGSNISISRNDGTSSFGEIVTIAESPLDPRVLWVGTDDGNVQVSEDGGVSWSDVGRNARGAPDGTYVSRVEASATGRGAAYVTFDAHRDGDFAPYVVRTEDFGQSWTPLTNGLDAMGSANVIREHPHRPNVLFLGTEHALYVSTNRGAQWTRFSGNLPTTLYDDLVVHPRDNDLVVGTHGRSLFILDDVGPLTEWSTEVAAAPAHLFSVRDATITQYWKDTSYRGQAAYAGQNAPDGAILTYHLSGGAGAASMEIANRDGQVIRRYRLAGEGGTMHRITWDLRHELPAALGGDAAPDARGLPRSVGPRGPFVSPGPYTATVIANGTRSSQTFMVRGDPEMPITAAQHRERETFLLAVMAAQVDALQLMGRVRSTAQDASGDRAARLASLRRDLGQAAGSLRGMMGDFNGSGVRQGTLYPPTDTHRQRLRDARAIIDRVTAAL